MASNLVVRSNMNIRVLWALLFVCTSCSNTFADETIDVQKVCAAVSGVNFPTQDRPSRETANGLSDCSSVDLYYGIGMPLDFIKARQCAFLEIDRGDHEIWGGSSILMMIYANARGTERNFGLAIKLACQNDLAPGGGQEYRIKHLAELRDKKWEGNNFSICDDTTSGYWQGNCEWLKERIANAKRNAQLEQISSQWSVPKKEALALLEDKFNRFVQLRTENEVDLSGTARSAMQIEEESVLRKEFLAKLEMLNNGALPQFTLEQFAGADKELNSVYQQIQLKTDLASGTVTREGVKKTQRSWLVYRDAWVKFGRQQFPDVGADNWKTWITRERVKMLMDLLE